MNHLMQTYARYPLTLVRGEGSWVFDDQGKAYLDFVAGIAVSTLGHAHPTLVNTIQEQARKMLHCSNLYHIPNQTALADRLCTLSGLDAAFFCNSGAEANESAIKIVRKYFHDHGSDRRTMITATQSFHGRTMQTLTATGQDKVKLGFNPLPTGFTHVALNDIDNLKRMLDKNDHNIAAIMLEPLQGEGGVNLANVSYLQQVRSLCDEHGILLVLDEVQTGIGRTGTMFAFEQADIQPDIITLAKGLGGGVPIGAMLATEKIAAAFSPGTHGSTFGGNPLSSAAALSVLDVIESEHLLANVRQQSIRLKQGFTQLADKHHWVEHSIRGEGLLLGLTCAMEVAPLIDACREKGLLLLSAGAKVLRFLPPLNVSTAEVEEALKIMSEVFEEVT
ncbi:MAG: aspartate aminotransferase family protein [Mariprofundaceae bacterium]